MMLRPLLPAAVLVAFAAACPTAVLASSGAPVAAEPLQFYVFSFTDTPAAEAAQDVVTGALGLDLTIDPAVDGVVTFRTEGWSGSEALLQDFGTALLDQDIALMRTGSGAYTLTLRNNVPVLVARGGMLMRLPEPAMPQRPPKTTPVAGSSVEAPPNRWWDNALTALLIFSAGAIAGAAALLGGQTVYRRARAKSRSAAPVLQLTDQREPADWQAEDTPSDPDLIIPRFEGRPDPEPALWHEV